MKSRREFYKNYVGKRVQIPRFIFISMIVIMFGITLYDSFTNNLPFYYVLFFLLGYFISLSFKKTQKIYWDETGQKIMRRMGFFGFLLILTLILARKLVFPEMFREFSVIYITDAILLISLGVFSGRIHILSKQIEEITFRTFFEKKNELCVSTY